MNDKDTIVKQYTARDMTIVKELKSIVDEIDQAAESLKKDGNEFAQAAAMGVSSARNIVYRHMMALGTVKEEEKE